MSKNIIRALVLGAVILCAFVYLQSQSSRKSGMKQDTSAVSGSSDSVGTASEFKDSFSATATLEEASKMTESENQDWWLSSGAYFIQENGVGKTAQGNLTEGSEWQIEYKKNDAGETDDGFHPQNIFRLVTRSKWLDYTQEVYYKINNYYQSKDVHRSESNGLFFFNRYQDENNLYYTGLRVDGAAVIKKKVNGIYYTMAYKSVFAGKYDRESQPNLLPLNTQIGLKSEVMNNSDGTVNIKLFIDRNKNGKWELILETKDDGKSFGGGAILNEGYAGLRTDFMDAEFDDYKILRNN
jgi:hypothetical protein